MELRVLPVGRTIGENLPVIHALTFSGGGATVRKTRWTREREAILKTGVIDDLTFSKCRHGIKNDRGVYARRSYHGNYHADSRIMGEVWDTEAVSVQ